MHFCYETTELTMKHTAGHDIRHVTSGTRVFTDTVLSHAYEICFNTILYIFILKGPDIFRFYQAMGKGNVNYQIVSVKPVEYQVFTHRQLTR